MRKIACFLLLLGGVASLPAADTWRWRDANGVVHFSDRPAPGAELIQLGTAPKPGTTAAAMRTAASAATTEPAEGQIVPYVRCVLIAPANDQVLLNETHLPISFELQPALQLNHRVQMLLNGAPSVDWPSTAVQGSLAILERGSYTLVGRVVDDVGRDLCTSPLVNFHVRLPTVPQVRATPR